MTRSININTKLFYVTILTLFLLSFPIFGLAQTTNTGITFECPPTQNPITGAMDVYGNCTFDQLIQAVKKVVNWATVFVLEFSVVVIAYAGFKYMTSGDSASQRREANEMLRKVAIGIVLILAAWLIVNLVTTVLLGKSLDTILQP